MITEADLNNWFEYHKPTEGQIPLFKKLRDAAHEFAHVIVECTPPSPDQTAAIRQVRMAVMAANAAIACDQLRIEIEEVADVITFRSYWRVDSQDNMIFKFETSRTEISTTNSVRELLHIFVGHTTDIIDNHQVRAERIWKALEQASCAKSLPW